MPITFPVTGLSTCSTLLPTETSLPVVWKSLVGVTPEKLLGTFQLAPSKQLFKDTSNKISNHFVRAVHYAYDKHYPLVLSPDHIWTVIIQGFAFHVNENAEKLKSLLVSFEGKKTITIDVPSSPNWEQVIPQFSEKIKEHIGEQTHSLVVSNFSTTTPTERITSEIILMDALQQYFNYKCMTECGIPSITLEGVPEDWEEIRQRAAGLAKYDMQWWLEHLLPILDEFVLAAHGKPNKFFWHCMYKVLGGSGGPYLTGWICDLFPYLKPGHQNTHLGWQKLIGKSSYSIPFDPNSFKGSMSKCPVLWESLKGPIELKFCAGFVGVSQDKNTFALRPELGWAVIEESHK